MLAILKPSLLHKADCSIELPSIQGLDVSLWGVLDLQHLHTLKKWAGIGESCLDSPFCLRGCVGQTTCYLKNARRFVSAKSGEFMTEFPTILQKRESKRDK